MASLSKQSSSGKPKLDRRNAKKISDYEPSDSPRSFRTLDKGFSKSFRVTGEDSQGEIEKLCEVLGISGGADAFSIPQEAWEAGKARSGSFERFFLDQNARSKSLDEPLGSFFDHRDRGSGGEIASPPLQREAHRSPFYNSMSSSSGDSFTSDTSIITGTFDMPKNQIPLEQVRDSGLHGIQYCDNGRTDTVFSKSHRVGLQRDDDDCQTSSAFLRAGDPGLNKTQPATEPGIYRARHQDDLQIDNVTESIPAFIEQTTCSIIETKKQIPPPASCEESYLPRLSTHEVLTSFAPDEHVNAVHHQLSDEEDRAQSDSEGDQTDALEDELGSEFGFVSEILQKHGVLAKQQSLSSSEDAEISVPSTPEHNGSNISIQSWRKLDLLGSGSFGTVYEGMSEDGVYFAVKEVSLSESDSKAQQCVTQLEQEIEFLSKFQHENIVRYLGTQKEPDKLYIFLELVTKGSLASLYQKYKLFESQIRSYTRQILSGLKYLHEHKTMHRDIKCANILVDINGKIKVADFGLAKQISQLDELKSCKGSAYWMAPEVIDPKKTYSFSADIWSLGCTVLEMETRMPPFGDMEWHRALWKVGHGEAPPIPDSLSDDAKDFLRKCLQVNPAKRPSASQLLEHPFVQYVGGTGLTPRNSFTQETEDLSSIV